ncbi:DUF202 domain-containing protein [Streptomyces sp. NPDC046821]|uniref:DUF202 domain-containing protein n=1 Tax=Streptomyces sp. NPDC046821 TaxID=3154702 RepID=UPI0033DB1050
MTDRLWDPGLQNERTALAWQRTLLSLLVAALLTSRVAMADASVAATALAFTSVTVVPWLIVVARRRYTRAEQALHAQRALPASTLPATVACLTAAIGMVELIVLFSHG